MTERHVTFREGALHIEGHPQAVKAVSLVATGASDDVRYLTDLARSRQDLEHVFHVASRLLQDTDDPPIVREALWRSAVVTLCLCFDNHKRSERRPLRVKTVYPNPQAREALRYIQTLRDKDVAHDDGATIGADVCAVIGPDGGPEKVLEVTYLQARGVHSSPESVHNLRRLAGEGATWTANEFDRVLEKITNDLRGRPYEELLRMPASRLEVKKDIPFR